QFVDEEANDDRGRAQENVIDEAHDDREARIAAVFSQVRARQNAERCADRQADRRRDHAADDRVEEPADHSGRGGILGEDIQRQPADPIPQQGRQDNDQHAQAQGRRRVGETCPDDVAPFAPGIEVGHRLHALISRLASSQRAAARTMNVMTNRMKPRASSDAVKRPGSASANWLAIIAEMVVPWARMDDWILVALPMTKVTAIVSPSARPRASITPPITPTRVKGMTMLPTTSKVVAPTPYAASFNTVGTVSKTSRDTAVMKGRIMSASTSPAVSTP